MYPGRLLGKNFFLTLTKEEVIPAIISFTFPGPSHLVLDTVGSRCDGWGCCSQLATIRKYKENTEGGLEL